MTVQEMTTFKGDITLSTLLSDVAAFDVVGGPAFNGFMWILR